MESRALVWFGGGFVAAIGIGWVAALLHASGRAPLGLMSLGVGLALGATLAGLAATQRVADPPPPPPRTVILAFITVLAEHAWLYRDFRRQWHEARAESAEVALFRPAAPWSPAEYFARELTPGRAALWGVDAALLTAAAVGTVAFWQRQSK